MNKIQIQLKLNWIEKQKTQSFLFEGFASRFHIIIRDFECFILLGKEKRTQIEN